MRKRVENVEKIGEKLIISKKFLPPRVNCYNTVGYYVLYSHIVTYNNVGHYVVNQYSSGFQVF